MVMNEQNKLNETLKPLDVKVNPIQEGGFEGKSLIGISAEEKKTAYRKLNDFFSVAEIGPPQVRRELTQHANALKRGSPEYDVVIDTMKENQMMGFLLLQDGKIKVELYQDLQQTDQWVSFSVGKAVISILVGVAVKEGIIKSLDTFITNYLPELEGSCYEKVTIEHLLRMSSGVGFSEIYGDPNADFSQMSSARKQGIEVFLAYMKARTKMYEPGTVFNYNSAEAHLLGEVLRRAVGYSLPHFFAETLGPFLGMEQSVLWALDQTNHEITGGMMAMSLRDYGRLGLLMMNDGKIGDMALLPDDWVRKSSSVVSGASGDYGRLVADNLQDGVDEAGAGFGYGYEWWLFPPPEKGGDPIHYGAFEARGIFGQRVYINSRQKAVAVCLCAWPSTNIPAYRNGIHRLISKLLQV
jgi:CubicO group peptidase (beta-lactamase class C family)